MKDSASSPGKETVKRLRRAVLLGLFAAAALVYFGWAWGWSWLAKAGQNPEKPAAKEEPVPDDLFKNRIQAPSLEGGVGWLNVSGPIRIDDLRGKVVLLDFWTYCCINCMHMLPVLKQLEEKYPNELVVIGVHSAKFFTEQESDNIRQAILRYEITHPVVNDAEMAIWQRYAVNSWPTLRVIDPEGYLVAGDSGEIPFEALDQFIGTVVKHHRKKGTLEEGPLHFKLERESLKETPLLFPGKVLADAEGGRLFIADSNHNRLVVTTLEGKVLEVIGTGQIGADDGAFDRASFNHPQGMALDGQVLYVADTENHLLRKVDLASRQVTTIAGTGQQATFRVGGGPGRQTVLSSPWDLVAVGGKLYIAMAGPHQLWVMDLASGTVEPYAGSGREDILDGPLAQAAMAQPSGITTDGQWVYVVDSEGSAVRAVSLDPQGEVQTLVGPQGLARGQALFEFGDRDGKGGDVRLQHPLGIVHHDGRLYVADTYNDKIKVVDPQARTARTLLGDGEPGDRDDPPRFDEPGGISVAGDRLYVADTNNHLIRVADLGSGKVSRLELSGLAPPKPLAAKRRPSFPNATTLTLDRQEVRAGEKLVLSVGIQLAEGFKLNPDAPLRYLLEGEGNAGVIARAELGQLATVNPPRTSFEIAVPVSAQKGEDQLRLSLVYYSCREGAEAVCKIHSVIWQIPLQFSPTAASDRIELTTAMDSTGGKGGGSR